MVSEKQLVQQRQAWARGLVLRAWRRVEFLADNVYADDETRDRADDLLRDACAIAEEWGVDPSSVVCAEEKRAAGG